jgi:hypothetical protein
MSDEKPNSILSHKNFGRLLLLGTIGYMTYAASGDPGMRMMFGQSIHAAELVKEQIANMQEAGERLKIVQSIPEDWRIHFKTQSSHPKGTLVAFVDPMCVNCRSLIAKTGEINQMGYSIDYVVAPLPGDDRVMAADSVTCAAKGDQAAALLSVAGDKAWSVPSNGCTNASRYNMIENSILSKWDIKGRPYIITPNGVGIQGSLNMGSLTQALSLQPTVSGKN